MKPVSTNTTNCTLKGNDPSVIDLPITKLRYTNGVKAVESCWELSDEELQEVIKTKKIYFMCLGETHPPILLKTTPEIKE